VSERRTSNTRLLLFWGINYACPYISRLVGSSQLSFAPCCRGHNYRSNHLEGATADLSLKPIYTYSYFSCRLSASCVKGHPILRCNISWRPLGWTNGHLPCLSRRPEPDRRTSHHGRSTRRMARSRLADRRRTRKFGRHRRTYSGGGRP
jgi:hypothetical protein